MLECDLPLQVNNDSRKYFTVAQRHSVKVSANLSHIQFSVADACNRNKHNCHYRYNTAMRCTD